MWRHVLLRSSSKRAFSSITVSPLVFPASSTALRERAESALRAKNLSFFSGQWHHWQKAETVSGIFAAIIKRTEAIVVPFPLGGGGSISLTVSFLENSEPPSYVISHQLGQIDPTKGEQLLTYIGEFGKEKMKDGGIQVLEGNKVIYIMEISQDSDLVASIARAMKELAPHYRALLSYLASL